MAPTPPKVPARPWRGPEQRMPFDPATGAWQKPTPPAQSSPKAQPPREPSVDPAARRRGPLATVCWILLILDLVAVGFLLLNNVLAGAVLLAAPDSALAEDIRQQLEDVSTRSIFTNSLLSFLLFGVVPFLWVLGTRQRPWLGTRKYLRLDGTWKDLAKGALLTVPLLVGVLVLLVLYTLLTEGPQALSDPGTGENPAVDSIVANLNWPLAFAIALFAGVGEEVLFRGVLQKRIGVWGQSILFGLAHAGGGYVPQVLFAAGLGVLFGLLLRRGWPLWSLMVAHFLYDFVLLSTALLFPELG